MVGLCFGDDPDVGCPGAGSVEAVYFALCELRPSADDPPAFLCAIGLGVIRHASVVSQLQGSSSGPSQ